MALKRVPSRGPIKAAEHLIPVLPQLEQGKGGLDWALKHDAEYPELSDILTQGGSNGYSITTDQAWMPITTTRVVNIPDIMFEQYNATKIQTHMGLFPEIQRAWMTVDNKLYLWNYMNGEDFQSFEDQVHAITYVKLVKPKPGLFVAGISHLLVIVTASQISLMGVSAAQKGEITLYGTQMNVQNISGSNIVCVEGTNDGRIFLAGLDGELYELSYDHREKWFWQSTQAVCRTKGSTSSVLSMFSVRGIWGGKCDPETIVQIVVDDSRSLIYTLGSKATIRAYHLVPDGVNLMINHTSVDLSKGAKMLGVPAPYLSADPSKEAVQVVSIWPVGTEQSRILHLVAVLSTGCRLYLAATSGNNLASSSLPPNSMQVRHVRYPPTQVTGTDPNQITTALLSPTTQAHLFPSNLFLAFVGKDKMFASTPNTGKIAMSQQYGAVQFTENATWVPLEGSVHDVALINNASSAANDLATQFSTPFPEIAVLTNMGVYLLRKMKAAEILGNVIKHGSASALGLEGEVRKYFENMTREEGCANSLALACGYGGTSDDSAAFRNSIYNSPGARSRQGVTDVVETARKCFIEFGGRPVAQPDANGQYSLDNVALSGRYFGLAKYMARLLVPVWKKGFMNQVVVSQPGQPGILTYAQGIPSSVLQRIQRDLIILAQFLEENRNSIDGLAGSDQMMGIGLNRPEELALQAEHRAMNSLAKLLTQVIEGISFLLVLFDKSNQLHPIMMNLSGELRQQCLGLSHELLFITPQGKEVVKELVTQIVNQQISAGVSVDAVSETLRKKCGSFCSADDVLMYKAIEQLRRAKQQVEGSEDRYELLRESLRLFTKTAGSLSVDTLKEAVDEFQTLNFHAGAIELALDVAKACDPNQLAFGYLADGKAEIDTRAPLYSKRMGCYSIVFNLLQDVDSRVQDEATARMAYEVTYNANDELFHSALYDWYLSKGLGDRLLDLQTAYIEAYLERNSKASPELADMLWQYYVRKESWLQATKVLSALASGDFKIPLEGRIEYLSRARFHSHMQVPIHERQAMAEIAQTVQEELDVAQIQAELVGTIKDDERPESQVKARMIDHLDGKLRPLNELFNNYADPLGYGEVCLAIFQAADYRVSHEITACWEKIIQKEHERSVVKGTIQPWEAVSEVIRRLGLRFSPSESIFEPEHLVPMVEKYSLEKQKDVAPSGWVPKAFLSARVPPEQLFSILDEMYDRKEYPWQGKAALLILVRDILVICEHWVNEASKLGTRFAYEKVLAALAGYGKTVEDRETRQRLSELEAEIRRKF
ncbi:hypothetical protein YB2330_005220 [Saitoella coloradoensis]